MANVSLRRLAALLAKEFRATDEAERAGRIVHGMAPSGTHAHSRPDAGLAAS